MYILDTATAKHMATTEVGFDNLSFYLNLSG